MTEETDSKLPTTTDQNASAPEVRAGAKAELEDDRHAAVDEGAVDEDELEDEAESAEEQRDPRRPAFLDHLPDNPELRPLVEAFVEGNYARLRSLERELRNKTKDPELLAVARELVERTEPDPLAKKLLALSIVFFLFIVAWVYLHNAH